jgi:hypothetical protein
MAAAAVPAAATAVPTAAAAVPTAATATVPTTTTTTTVTTATATATATGIRGRCGDCCHERRRSKCKREASHRNLRNRFSSTGGTPRTRRAAPTADIHEIVSAAASLVHICYKWSQTIGRALNERHIRGVVAKSCP